MDFEPEPLFADFMLSQDAGLMVIVAERNYEIIVRLLGFSGFTLSDRGIRHADVSRFDVARRPANAAWKRANESQVALVFSSRLSLAQLHD